MLVKNNLTVNGPVQPDGEGEGFPVTTKEYAVLQAAVGEAQAWIVQHRNQKHCTFQMVHMLVFTCLLFVCIWGWWLKTDASQTHAAEVEKKEAVCSDPTGDRESNTWGLFAFLLRNNQASWEGARLYCPSCATSAGLFPHRCLWLYYLCHWFHFSVISIQLWWVKGSWIYLTHFFKERHKFWILMPCLFISEYLQGKQK